MKADLEPAGYDDIVADPPSTLLDCPLDAALKPDRTALAGGQTMRRSFEEPLQKSFDIG